MPNCCCARSRASTATPRASAPLPVRCRRSARCRRAAGSRRAAPCAKRSAPLAILSSYRSQTRPIIRCAAGCARRLQRPAMPEPVLTVTGLRKFFTVTRGFRRSRTVTVRALDGISFRVRDGEAFGLVGESGCGKSTAGRAVLRLVEPDAGEIVFKGENIIAVGKERMRALRRKLQIIFQDPYASLNPRRMIGKALIEPMRVHGMADRVTCEERAKALLAEVGLPENAMMRYPHEFSGGQRQRIGIARSLTLEPELLVADEPVSALDVSIQSQILLLLQRLQERRRLAFIFISHDLGVVRYFCQSMAVMYLRRIVETGPIPDIFKEPLHPSTQKLGDALGDLDEARVITIPFDARDRASCAAWVERTVGHFGRIDGLVNNAGISLKVGIEDDDEAAYDAMWEVNVKGPLRLIRLAMPYLRRSGTGRVVNVASLSGKRAKNANAC